MRIFKSIKKAVAWFTAIGLILAALIFGGYAALRSPYVQTRITQRIADYLSGELNTTITVNGVDIGFFNRLIIEGLYVEDQQGDTLGNIQRLHIGVKSLNIEKHKILIDRLTLDSVVFNALIGNHDAHAKNFSLLYAGQTPVLAPFYDLLSTAVYPKLTPKMAMKIGSKYKFSEVQARHWAQFAQSAGLAKAAAKKRILALAKALPGAARSLQQATHPPFAGNAVVQGLVVLIEQRCALTVQRLSAPMTDEDVSPD